jgi:hypothetical protein
MAAESVPPPPAACKGGAIDEGVISLPPAYSLLV